MCYSTPCLYGQLKTHKSDMPIRLLITCYTSPAFLLSRFLVNWFQRRTNFIAPHSIQKSTQLANEIKGMRFTPDCHLISFYVSSMFTNIPIGKAVDAMYKILVKLGVNLDTTDEFEELILLCAEQNICKFDGKMFKFPGDLPVGGPMSSLIAKVLMDRLEHWVLRRWSSFGNVILWYQYVDDIFCIWQGSYSYLDRFQKVLHSFDSNLQFTMEISGCQIHYLNLSP